MEAAAEPRAQAGPLLSARIRSAGYRGEPVLRDVELELWSGETLLVLGPSGSGKTTLILALTGVLSGILGGYVEGDVRLAGVDPTSREGFEAVPRLVGVVLQDPDKQISMPTPYDEVMFTLENLGYPEEEASRRTEEILGWAGLGDKMFREVESLSGGEKKRLCIAASIVHEPRLLIFDEPTANLDPRGVGTVLGYMDRLRARGYSMIVVEHKAGYFLDRADRILVLDSGRVAMALEGRPGAPDLAALEDLGIDTGLLRPRGRRRAAEGGAVVELRGVSYRYRGARQYALRGVELEVPRGSIYALVGHNGSGKTTVLRLIAGFHRPERGSVLVAGRSPWRMAGRERPRLVFMVPQEPDYLFSQASVGGELRLVARRLGISEEEALRNLGWPRSMLERSPYKLSHGQRRWLAYTIARLHEPEVMLLDEPTAGLDLRLLRELVSWLKSHSPRTTFIIATHDIRLVSEAATHAAVLEEGRVVGWGVEEALRYLGEAVGVEA